MNGPSKFKAWEVQPGRGPITKPVRIEHNKRPILVTGKNGSGKTSLLSLITSPLTSSLVFEGLPPNAREYWHLFSSVFDPSRLAESNRAEYERRLAFGAPLTPETLTENAGARLSLRETVLHPNSIEFRLMDPEASFTLPIRDSHVSTEFQRGINAMSWNSRLVDSRIDLSTDTALSFGRWMQSVIDTSNSGFRTTSNQLVLEQLSGGFVSILDVAMQWALRTSERATARFKSALGLDAKLDCSAPNNFSWTVRLSGGSALSVGQLSSGLRRWAVLVIQESCQEVEQKALHRMTDDTESFSPQVFPESAFPHSPPRLFVGQPSWLVLDEPELHLYPTEVRHLATALADLKTTSNSVIATHSLEFLSTFFGRSDIYVFDEPGILGPRSDFTSNMLLQRLVDDSPAILSRLHLLYVEGSWDKKILSAVLGEDLNRAGVLVRELGGVVASEKEVASPAELLGRPAWVLFDGLEMSIIEREWSGTILRLREDNRASEASRLEQLAGYGPFEMRAMYALLSRTIRSKLEGRVQLISHEMNDITEIIHPRRWGFSEDSWDACGYLKGMRFKDFILKRHGHDPSKHESNVNGQMWTKLLWSAYQNDRAEMWETSRVSLLRKALEPLFKSTIDR